MQTLFVKLAVWALILGFPVFSFAEKPAEMYQTRIGNDTYMAGASVYAGDAVSGDLIVAGGSVVSEGAIAEDAMVAGGNIDLASTVGGDVRIAGGNVVLSGAVKDSVVGATGQMTIRGTGIGGDVVWTGGNLSINAPVSGSVRVTGGSVFINAPVSGNVEFSGESLTLGKNAVVLGSIKYESPQVMIAEQGSSVLGTVDYVKKQISPKEKDSFSESMFGSAFEFLMGLVGSLVLGLLFHRFWEATTERMCGRRLFHFGLGFLILAVSPMAILALMITLIGIPLGMLSVFFLAGLFFLTALAMPVVVGSAVYKKWKKQEVYTVTWFTILLGAVILFLLSLIPILGGLIRFILWLIVLGVLSHSLWNGVKNFRK